MRLAIIGCNHQTAPLALRERMVLDASAATSSLARFATEFPDAEAVLLSTCNRTELYVARPLHGDPRFEHAVEWLARACALPPAEIGPRLYHHQEGDAIRHLFRVASGLDSMALGETQIVQQVKRAVDVSRTAGALGPALGALFDKALASARRVRRESGISRGRFSLGRCAVDLATRHFPQFDDTTLLMVGAGRMGEATLRHFQARGPRQVWLTSRTEARAHALAGRLGAEVRPFARLGEWVAASDIVVSCVAARKPVLTAESLAGVTARPSSRPLLVVDLGVPRSVAPELHGRASLHLYDLDDLEALAAEDRSQRGEAACEAEQRISAHVTEFQRERAAREAGPTIAAFRRHLAGLAAREFDWLAPKLSGEHADPPALVEQMLHRVLQKLLHTPSERLKSLAQEGKAEAYDRMLCRLFDLPRETKSLPLVLGE